MSLPTRKLQHPKASQQPFSTYWKEQQRRRRDAFNFWLLILQLGSRHIGPIYYIGCVIYGRPIKPELQLLADDDEERSQVVTDKSVESKSFQIYRFDLGRPCVLVRKRHRVTRLVLFCVNWAAFIWYKKWPRIEWTCLKLIQYFQLETNYKIPCSVERAL